jgi:hypothetical protein
MAVKENAKNATTAAPVAMYGTDNPSGFGAGSGVPFTYGDDFGTNIPTSFNPLTTLNPTQAFAQAQALAGSVIPTIPVSPISPASFSKIL